MSWAVLRKRLLGIPARQNGVELHGICLHTGVALLGGAAKGVGEAPHLLARFPGLPGPPNLKNIGLYVSRCTVCVRIRLEETVKGTVAAVWLEIKISK
jgi:hypothetical protein